MLLFSFALFHFHLAPKQHQTAAQIRRPAFVQLFLNVCKKRKLHSASSNSLPAPLLWACAHRGADGGENARFLLLCLRATKGIKGPFFLVLKCSPLALNTLGFSEPRSGVSGHSPLVVFFPTPTPTPSSSTVLICLLNGRCHISRQHVSLCR